MHIQLSYKPTVFRTLKQRHSVELMITAVRSFRKPKTAYVTLQRLEVMSALQIGRDVCSIKCGTFGEIRAIVSTINLGPSVHWCALPNYAKVQAQAAESIQTISKTYPVRAQFNICNRAALNTRHQVARAGVEHTTCPAFICPDLIDSTTTG